MDHSVDWKIKFSISDDDLQLFRRFNKHADQHFAEFIKDFSLWLVTKAESAPANSVFNIIVDLYRPSLFPVQIDTGYIEAINQIGELAVAEKIERISFNAVINFLTLWWINCIDQKSPASMKEKLRLTFSKLRMLDLALIFNIYHRERIFSLQQTKTLTSSVMNRMVFSLERWAKGEMNFCYEAHTDDEYRFKNAINALIERLRLVVDDAKNIQRGNFTTQLKILGVHDDLGIAFVNMINNQSAMHVEKEIEKYIKIGLAHLDHAIKGERNLFSFAQKTIGFLCRYVGATTGTFYTLFDEEEEKRLRIVGIFVGNSKRKKGLELSIEDMPLINEAMAFRKIVVAAIDSADDHLSVTTGFSVLNPKTCTIFPITVDDEVLGILEMGSYKNFSENNLRFVEQVCHVISSSLKGYSARSQIRNLLEQSKAQTLKLEAQKEKLRKSYQALSCGLSE